MGQNYTNRRRLLSDQEIVRLYIDEHLDSSSIGQLAGCSSSTVLSVLRLAGIPRRPPGTQPRPVAIADAEIVQRYRAGDSAFTISLDARCCQTTIGNILRRHNVPLRPRSESLKLAAERQRQNRHKNR